MEHHGCEADLQIRTCWWHSGCLSSRKPCGLICWAKKWYMVIDRIIIFMIQVAVYIPSWPVVETKTRRSIRTNSCWRVKQSSNLVGDVHIQNISSPMSFNIGKLRHPTTCKNMSKHLQDENCFFEEFEELSSNLNYRIHRSREVIFAWLNLLISSWWFAPACFIATSVQNFGTFHGSFHGQVRLLQGAGSGLECRDHNPSHLMSSSHIFGYPGIWTTGSVTSR